MLPDVFSLLNVAAVRAFVGTPPRIYRHGQAPQDAVAPYITWFSVYGRPEITLSETPAVDNYTIQVDCWSNNTGTGSTQVNALAMAVRDTIEARFHVTAQSIDEQDFQTQRYRIGLQFTYFEHRAP
ncbi:MAG: DUF3168 domain-containing protein [Pseudomonadota bacterium]|nr:DUF3168 domain-containing protein [Pseudomonadota bacterium]